MSNFGPVLHSSQGDEPLDFNNVQLGDTRDMAVKTLPYERQFNPYDFNGGTNVVLAGEDYAIAAGCTRMSTGYEILSRDQTKLFSLIMPMRLTKLVFFPLILRFLSIYPQQTTFSLFQLLLIKVFGYFVNCNL